MTLLRPFFLSLPTLGALSSLCALMPTTAGVAAAQGHPTQWKGVLVRPLNGAWSVDVTALETLSVVPVNPGAMDTIQMQLPPTGMIGVAPSVELTFAPLDSAVAAAIQPGAELRVETFGERAGVPNESLGFLRIVKDPSGNSVYEYDLGATGATLFTMELWDGPTQIAVLSNVPGGNGGGPFFTPNCTCPTCPASAYCCEIGAVYYSNGLWWNQWWCRNSVEFNGNTYTDVTRVVLIPQNPSVPIGDVTTLAISGQERPPFELTELSLAGFAPIGASYCTAIPNSTGEVGSVAAVGSAVVASNQLDLYAVDLPDHAFGYFVVSPFQAFVPNAGGSQGNLCIGASTGRFLTQLGNTGTTGSIGVHLNLSSLPQPNGPVAVQSGQSWNFQCWHRDANPGGTSNFTSGYSILFL